MFARHVRFAGTRSGPCEIKQKGRPDLNRLRRRFVFPQTERQQNRAACRNHQADPAQGVTRLEAAPWSVVRWLPTDIKEEDLDALSLPTGARLAYDLGKNPVILFQNEWSANYFGETNKNTPLSALPVQTAKE